MWLRHSITCLYFKTKNTYNWFEMTTFITRLLMGLVFVFTTMSTPLYASVMPGHMNHGLTPASVTVDTDGMDEECAKAMASAAQEDADSKQRNNTGGECCEVGCKCPQSHQSNSALGVISNGFELFVSGDKIVPEGKDDVLPSYLSGILKRPPRA